MSVRGGAFFLIASLGTAMSAFESNATKIDNLEAEVQELKEQLKEITAKNHLNENGGKLANASPYVMGENDFAQFSVLYWQAKVDDTEFCYTNNSPASSPPINGENVASEPDWSWGFRAGVGKHLPYDGWNLSLLFTYFRPSGSITQTASNASAVIPTRGSLVDGNRVTKAKSEYNLDYYGLDFMLDRFLSMTSSFTVGLGMGVKSQWIDQKQQIRYEGGSLLDDNVKLVDSSDFWGIGPRGILNLDWYLGQGFAISGMFSPTLLYGYVTSSYNEKHSRILTDSIQMKEQIHRFNPMLEANLGLSWSRYVNSRKQFISLSLSYETQYLFNQVEFLRNRFNTFFDVSDGDLGIHGVTFAASLSF